MKVCGTDTILFFSVEDCKKAITTGIFSNSTINGNTRSTHPVYIVKKC